MDMSEAISSSGLGSVTQSVSIVSGAKDTGGLLGWMSNVVSTISNITTNVINPITNAISDISNVVSGKPVATTTTTETPKYETIIQSKPKTNMTLIIIGIILLVVIMIILFIRR